jgi:hypothetical protein
MVFDTNRAWCSKLPTPGQAVSSARRFCNRFRRFLIARKTDDIRLGLAATETAVKQAKLDQYRIVYFATHGLLSGDLKQFAKSTAEPALALTIPDKPSDFDDGLLSTSEIA